jgi:hypothetical protein
MSSIREDMRDGFKGLNQRLDRNISVDVFKGFQDAMYAKFGEIEKDVAEIKAARETEAKQRASDRRLILAAVFTSVLAPLFLLLLNQYLTSKGAK